MIAQELRIGNYISRLDLVSENQRIEQILELLSKKVVTTGPTRVIVLYEDIKPIPLTEEWLLKFDYKKEVDFFENETRLSFWTDKKTFDGIMADWADKVIGQVKYVHQLQNLYFALTGEELTIKVL